MFIKDGDQCLVVDNELEGGRKAEEVEAALFHGPLDGAQL